jgi:hypothetical protein
MPISANQAKIHRKRAKRAKDGPLLHHTIESACDRFFERRGLPIRKKFNGWESRRKTEQPNTDL